MEPKSVLITGCSTGIGNCLARGLRERGYRVFASARRETDVAALSAAGFESLPLDLDSSGSRSGPRWRWYLNVPRGGSMR